MNTLQKLSKDEYTLIDVRTSEEVSMGKLENAVHIPLNELSGKMNLISKSKPVYLYCASGSRSGVATSMLKEAGYEAYNLGGYSSLKGM